MRAIDPGWCNRRPLIPPKKCRHCNGPMRLVRPNRSAIYICPECDTITEERRGVRRGPTSV